MKAFIEANFKMIDIDGDGIIGAKEYRYNCITRIAVENIQLVDDAFNKLLDVNVFNPWLNFSTLSLALNSTIFFSFFKQQDEDRRKGGLTLARYQELYGHYLGNTDEAHPGKKLIEFFFSFKFFI